MPRTRNRLADEKSPYLLQHADNPVDWYPWGAEALDRAEDEDKPILVSIGYSTCHWCHVMEKESFTDPEVADLMNRHFVCIKVDREERPDVDTFYMAAVNALSGFGGWPLNVFLTSDRKPFFGGTYFPPRSRPGMPCETPAFCGEYRMAGQPCPSGCLPSGRLSGANHRTPAAGGFSPRCGEPSP